MLGRWPNNDEIDEVLPTGSRLATYFDIKECDFIYTFIFKGGIEVAKNGKTGELQSWLNELSKTSTTIEIAPGILIEPWIFARVAKHAVSCGLPSRFWLY